MYKLALIGLGGLFGTLARYWLSQWVDDRSQASFPFGTLAVNLLGCFAAGFLFYALEQAAIGPEFRLAVFTGFLGGFTTFSAYGLQTLVLARGGMAPIAAINVLASNVAGLLMVWLGSGLSRGLFQRF